MSSRPYGETAFRYKLAGWRGPLPTFDKERKKPGKEPPEGFTGWKHGDTWPDDDQLAEWVRSRGYHNIALRLPRNVVGLDVDVWKGEAAVETIVAITKAHGQLPRTWVTTSRSDLSGIRLFRLPFDVTGGRFKGNLNHPSGDDRTAGEVIHHGHRVAVVWPSIHPDTGIPYRWIDQETGESVDDGRIPKPSDLPMLPGEWVDHLAGECSCFAARLTIRMNESKDSVAKAFERWHSKLTSGSYSRHDAALGGTRALAAFEHRKWPSAAEYLTRLEEAFYAAATTGQGARTDQEARDEWRRMLDGAEAKAATTSIPEWRPAERSREPKKTLSGPAGRRLELVRASTIAPLPVRWVWKDRIPVGEITATPGLAGVGKSTAHAWIIAQLTRGLLPGVHQGTAKPVIICASEDSWERSIVPRLMAAGADLDLVWRADVVTDDNQRTKVTLPADIDALEADTRDRGVALISLDPLLSTIDRNLDSYKSHEVRVALEPLHVLADRTRSSILANCHFNKSTGTDPLLRISGAAAFGEVCRAALAFAYDKDAGTYVISQVKNNLGRLDLPNLSYRLDPETIHTAEGPSEVAKLVFTGETARGVKEVLNPHFDPEKGEREIARDVIIGVLKSGPASWETISKAIAPEGISERTGRRARDELLKERLIGKSGGGGQPWLWHLNEVVHLAGGWTSGQVGQVEVVQPEEVVQPVDKQKLNGDAYLSNLSKEEENLREDALEHDGGQVAGKAFEAAEALLTGAGLLFTEVTAVCEVCAKTAEPCTCDLRCPDHPDEDDEVALFEHEGVGCDLEKALGRCRHRGPLHSMRGSFMHMSCAPRGWVPEVETDNDDFEPDLDDLPPEEVETW